ncbi:right-handed parallel beta-helix repeat-containing protein [Paenibacillus macquariensis]|uniref:Nitrous oxidase accessory protein n=1 Tax=Paenibacillus macquariensis TaxID=948756 RepID=A0ABY1JPY1_9BACL|nr:NosD domain-containing protein [Paenibacillus macquariensis]MEC0094089.1 NosD domain-containing protein [Paenibacillus macquariensis]SIQ56108.1 nitrous oxidase accessory protein [Paenibacillus macquariensis]
MIPSINTNNTGTLRILILMLFSLFLMYPASCGTVSANPNPEVISLQPIIDAANNGDSITLAPGTYLGPVHIDKRLTINGEGRATLLNSYPDAEVAVLISADDAKLKGLNIQQDNGGEAAAIRVEADQVTLEDLSIHTAGFGIVLREANDCVIANNKIRWFTPKGAASGTRGNGIDLYNSQGTNIRANEISYLRDGIYLENSRNTKVDQNRLYYLRYAIHCMYINGSSISNNIGEYNITGAMVMGVKDVVVSGNSFRKQSQNVHSQGILLYDVSTSSIVNNLVEGNRVGIYMQQSSDNTLQNNLVLRNYIGIQFEGAGGNQFQRNGFIANVIEAHATGSKNNQMNGNYWDSFEGLDITGDGISDLPYAINPFYQQLITKNAAYQLFFQSPGMTFLSDMYTNGKAQWSTDPTPLMQLQLDKATQGQASGGQGLVMLVGLLLLFVSVITIIYMGVLRL